MKILLIAAIAALLSGVAFADPVSALTFSVGATGTPNEFDVEAAAYVVAAENVKRVANSQAPLPTSTNAELKASYLQILTQMVLDIHTRYAKQAARQSEENEGLKDLWLNATQAARDAAKAALLADQKPQ